MASTKEYLDFVLEQLSGLDEISSRAMMEEGFADYFGESSNEKREDGVLWQLGSMY